MKRPKYEINNLEFTSDKALQSEISKRLKMYQFGEFLNQEDFKFMKLFFEKVHIYWKFKISDGLKDMRIKKNEKGRADSKSIVLINKHDEEVEISYTISKIKNRNYPREFREVMREVIRPQISNFRRNAFKSNSKLFCPIAKVEFTIDQSEVDHINPTFEEIVKTFISENKIELDSKLFPGPEEFDGTYRINSTELMVAFDNFHKEKCRLQVLSKDGHRTKTSNS